MRTVPLYFIFHPKKTDNEYSSFEKNIDPCYITMKCVDNLLPNEERKSDEESRNSNFIHIQCTIRAGFV